MITHTDWTIAFYVAIILLLIIFRNKFDRHGIVFLMRTKFGLKFIDKVGTKYKEWIKILGYTGVGIGFVGMVVIFYLLIQNIYTLIKNPMAPSGVSIIIPGVNIPGSPIQLPLVMGWLALFVVVLVHEFSHGIVSRSFGLKVLNSGIAFFGPLMGAFVEPDEKKLKKADPIVQHSIFAAGPFSNILLALIAVAFLFLVFNPLVSVMTEPIGFSSSKITEDFPAYEAGMQDGVVITSINNVNITDFDDFANEIKCTLPGETVLIGDEAGERYFVKTTEHPDNPDKAYLGVMGLKNERRLKQDGEYYNVLYAILSWLKELMEWIVIVSSGIGLANLLPLGPVDGGRMLQTALKTTKGKKGHKWWVRISILTLILLLVNILWPLFKWIISLIIGAI